MLQHIVLPTEWGGLNRAAHYKLHELQYIPRKQSIHTNRLINQTICYIATA